MLSESELLDIKGGIDKVVAGVIIVVIIFIIGIIDGYSNPSKCQR